MSQPLSNLAEGTRVNIVETINGTQYTVPMLIIANNVNKTNPYGTDVTLCVRWRCTGQAGSGTSQDGTCKYGATSTSVNYDGSTLDNFMSNEWLNRLDTDTQACISTSTIICYNMTDAVDYTLARKAFALSNKEVGGSYSTDHSVNPGYFTSNALRTAYNSGGTAAQHWWTRSPDASSACCVVYGSGNISASSPTYNYTARPACNFFSASLVSDEANEDGTYNLLPSEADPYRTLSFDCLIGETEGRASQARVDFAYICNGDNISIKLCNNYLDDSPTWEDAEEGKAHVFTNQTKTADSWAIGLYVLAKSENTIYVYEPAALALIET